MQYRGVLLAVLLSALFGGQVAGQSKTVETVEIKVDGSEPPPMGWSECISDLRGKEYSEQSAKACLKEVLATPYFLDGRLEVIAGEDVQVVFDLKAPRLTLTDLRFRGSDDDSEPIVEWLSAHKDTLRVGAIYDRTRELITASAVENYFRRSGRRVGVSSRLELDYARLQARLMYRIAEATPDPAERLLSPVGLNCTKLIGELNFTDVDDNVPMPLVNRLLRTQAFSCLDESKVRADIVDLRGTGLFSEVRASIQGPPDYSRVHFSIRGKDLLVAKVALQGFGKLKGTKLEVPTDLPLRTGQVYRRSLAWASIEHLKKLYSASGEEVRVFEDDEVGPGNNLNVRFEVLTYPQSDLFVNGTRVWPKLP